MAITRVELMGRLADAASRAGAAGQALADLRFNLYFLSRCDNPKSGVVALALFQWLVFDRTVAAVRLSEPSGPSAGPNDRPLVVGSTFGTANCRRIVANLRALLQRSGRPVVGFRQDRIKLGRIASLRLLAGCAVASARTARAMHADRLSGRLSTFVRTLADFEPLSAWVYNTPRLPQLLAGTSGFLTIDENWYPHTAMIRAARAAGVPTYHYPHGVIGPVVLPLVSDHQLFWNERMAATFAGPGHTAHAVGFVEGYRAPPPPAVRVDYDILITSQYHGYRLGLTDDPAALRDIFVAWRDVIASAPELRCVVKLHPNDTDEDRAAIREIFLGVSDRVLLLGGDVCLEWLVANCRVHSTVSSGSLFTSLKMSKPTVVFGDQRLVVENVPADLPRARTTAELRAAMSSATPAAAEWLSDGWTERAFADAFNGPQYPITPADRQ